MLKLHATETGAGQPVCLLHGLFGRLQNLAGIARHLAAAHRVISLDLRNHGASPHAAGMAYVDMAQDVLATLDGMGALPAALLGHSMGGKVAMAAALTAPSRVTRLVVGDIAPMAYAHHNAAVARALAALDLRPGLERRAADAALAAAVPDAAVRAFLLQNVVFTPTPTWRIGLREITDGIADIEGWPAALDTARFEAPALFIRGAQSDYVPADGLAAIRAWFPQADLMTLPQAGHWLHADQLAAFAAAVETFLAMPEAAA